jgi:hypothetical protein
MRLRERFIDSQGHEVGTVFELWLMDDFGNATFYQPTCCQSPATAWKKCREIRREDGVPNLGVMKITRRDNGRVTSEVIPEVL